MPNATTRQAEAIARIRERMGLETDPEALEVQTLERAERLIQLTRTPVWTRDLLPLLEGLHQSADRALMGSEHQDGLKRAELIGYRRALEDVVNVLGGAMELGQTAFRKLQERRFGKDGVWRE